MADQYAQVSSLGNLAPAVSGLLFGFREENNTLEISDAEKIPLESPQIQVDLHKAVFPKHKVLGWYRVISGNMDEPTPQDLLQTQALKEKYPDTCCIFALLQVSHSRNPGEDDKPKAHGNSGSGPQEDEGLPFSLYSLGEKAFLHREWELKTDEVERIAVEHIVRKKPKDDTKLLYVQKTEALQESLLGVQTRIRVLISFLEDIQSQRIPYDPFLCRQIQTLLYQLGPIAAAASSGSVQSQTSASTLSGIAQLGKMVDAIQRYTDKCRILNESGGKRRPTSTAAMRRF